MICHDCADSLQCLAGRQPNKAIYFCSFCQKSYFITTQDTELFNAPCTKNVFTTPRMCARCWANSVMDVEEGEAIAVP